MSGSTLASRLRSAATALIAVIEPIDEDDWHRVPDPGTWSIVTDEASR